MLKVRLFSVLFFIIALNALAQDISPTEQGDQNRVSNKENLKTATPPTPPIIVNVVQPPKTGPEIEEERIERERKAASDDKLVIFTERLAKYTFWLFSATIVLALATIGLFFWGWKQSIDMKESLAISKKAADAAADNAEVAVKSISPFLSPWVSKMDQLHPVDSTNIRTNVEGATFDSRIHLVFENYGTTPAIIREVRAELFLTHKDALPKVDFRSLTTRFHQHVVPGGWRFNNIITNVVDLTQPITLKPGEFAELLSEAKGDFRRIVVIGRVTYDDFLGYRHTRHFCVKMRLVPQGDKFGPFQTIFGGATYNRVTAEKIPASDPFGSAES